VSNRFSALWVLSCLAILFTSGCGVDKDTAWIDRLESLALADRIGSENAPYEVTVITTLDCAPCKEAWQALYPVIREGIESEEVRLTLVDIITDTEKNRAILEASSYVRALDPFAGLVLYDTVVGNYSELSADPASILDGAGMAHDYQPTAIDWGTRIEEALALNARAGIARVPVFEVNGETLTGQDAFALKEALEKALSHREQPP